MGQVWCKNKNWKEQDSNKSPLDRVFLRCAQRIYPRFKDEGSLNGATQRVSSSEIGYAGSPSTKELLRSRSISSVDRPFQPSDWVDVNLEVSNTPVTNYPNPNPNPDPDPFNNTERSLDMSFYQLRSTSNNKTPPVPPPRTKRRKKIRSLPALKINERASRNNIVKSKKDVEGKRREFYEHKVNGTGKIIPSKVVSGWKSAEGLSSHQNKLSEINNTSRVNNTSTSSLPNYDEFKLSKLSNVESCKDQVKQNENKSLESFNSCKYQNSSGRKLSSEQKPSSRIPIMQSNCDTDNRKFLSHPTKGSGSYSYRNVNKYPEHFSHEKKIENQRDYNSLTSDFDKFKQRDINYLFSPNEITTSRSHPFLNNGSIKNDHQSEFRPKLILRRVQSDDNGSLDIMSGSVENFVTKSISEESLPSALMEDADEINLFDDNNKEVVKNEITKIREELEAVTNEIKTPPRSPELKKNITKLSIDENDCDYDKENNINSMTPSLSEFEITLSDLLEKNSKFISLESELPSGKTVLHSIKSIDTDEVKELNDSDLISNSNSPQLITDTPKKPNRIQTVGLTSIPAPPRRKRRKKIKSESDDSPTYDFYLEDRLI
ncbi:uncharacterized protein LOC130672666 [Microplitis mediator]|uniref:uncharacterized protein LOC130672666 n=1 Tax=Microplitis mediator TaxID=375433 RepID=UPI00255545F2|nr:uncharacterized protein LOC130672666 [Microplitis mediator]XP_057333318.1 uncharacterized protein LOC130672666 [Microplitis mediator]